LSVGVGAGLLSISAVNRQAGSIGCAKVGVDFEASHLTATDATLQAVVLVLGPRSLVVIRSLMTDD